MACVGGGRPRANLTLKLRSIGVGCSQRQAWPVFQPLRRLSALHGHAPCLSPRKGDMKNWLGDNFKERTREWPGRMRKERKLCRCTLMHQQASLAFQCNSPYASSPGPELSVWGVATVDQSLSERLFAGSALASFCTWLESGNNLQ